MKITGLSISTRIVNHPIGSDSTALASHQPPLELCKSREMFYEGREKSRPAESAVISPCRVLFARRPVRTRRGRYTYPEYKTRVKFVFEEPLCGKNGLTFCVMQL